MQNKKATSRSVWKEVRESENRNLSRPEEGWDYILRGIGLRFFDFNNLLICWEDTC